MDVSQPASGVLAIAFAGKWSQIRKVSGINGRSLL